MGPGRFGIGFAAKRVAPEAPLWSLLLDTEVSDLLSFGVVAAGIERLGTTETTLREGITYLSPGYIPWSHGLFMSIVWSVVAAAAAFLFFRDRRTSVVIGLLVFSHWVLDFVVHGPDLPLLFGGSPLVGLGLWTSGPGLIISGVLEVALLAGGIATYLIGRRRDALAGSGA